MATLKNVELFRTGTHTDSEGRSREWTLDDLKKIVSRYNPANEEAPAVIGHPKQTAPAYGWLQKVKLVGDRILGDFYQVADEFIAALKAGRFKKRSISLDRELRIQHVGFLGAALPGVTGLKDLEFSAEAEMEIYEFTATNEGGKPKEDDTMTLEQALAEIEKLRGEIERLKDEGRDAEAAAKIKELEGKLKAAEEEASKAKNELSEYKKKTADKDLEARVDALVESGKLLPADKDDTLAFAKSMDGEGATMDFSKEDGSTEKVSPRERYLRKLEGAEANYMLNEFAKNGGSNFSKDQGDDDATDFAVKM